MGLHRAIFVVCAVVMLIAGAYAIQPGYPTNWYSGDTHMHSSHSDGTRSISTLAAYLRDTKKADWMFSTDHTPMVNKYLKCTKTWHGVCYSWAQAWEWNDIVQECEGTSFGPNFICIAGAEESNAMTEVGSIARGNSAQNHFLGINVGCIDCGINRVAECCSGLECSAGCISAYHIRETKNAGGVGIIAHPSGSWQYWDLTGRGINLPDDITGIEVWNGGAGLGVDEGAVAKWVEYLNQKASGTTMPAKFPVITGGSDIHWEDASQIGTPRTYCRMASLSKANVLDAIKMGRCEVSNGNLITFSINNAEMGDKANIYSGSNTVLVKAYSDGAVQLSDAAIYLNGVQAGTVSFANCTMNGSTRSCVQAVSLNVPKADPVQYVFIRMDNSQGHVLTNPVWLNVTDRIVLPPRPPVVVDRSASKPVAGKAPLSLDAFIGDPSIVALAVGLAMLLTMAVMALRFMSRKE